MPFHGAARQAFRVPPLHRRVFAESLGLERAGLAADRALENRLAGPGQFIPNGAQSVFDEIKHGVTRWEAGASSVLQEALSPSAVFHFLLRDAALGGKA